VFVDSHCLIVRRWDKQSHMPGQVDGSELGLIQLILHVNNFHDIAVLLVRQNRN
jgi:hypothetical protein